MRNKVDGKNKEHNKLQLRIAQWERIPAEKRRGFNKPGSMQKGRCR